MCELISLRPSNFVCACCPKVGWGTKVKATKPPPPPSPVRGTFFFKIRALTTVKLWKEIFLCSSYARCSRDSARCRRRQLGPQIGISLDRSRLSLSVLSLSLGPLSPPTGLSPGSTKTRRGRAQELRSDLAPRRSTARGGVAPPSAAPVPFPSFRRLHPKRAERS